VSSNSSKTAVFGLEGGFTGAHVVNNLTFAVYGVFGGIYLKPLTGANPPDVPGGGSKRDDCNLSMVAKSALIALSSTSSTTTVAARATSASTADTSDSASRREWGYLVWKHALPKLEASPRLSQGIEISITNGYSIGVDGVFEEVVGAGLSYSWSITTTTSRSVICTMKDDDAKHLTDDEKFHTSARWVYFPQLIKSLRNCF
jgi:hypothetical protein